MRIVIFGANGKTGRLLMQQTLDEGHTAVAVTRHPETFGITHPALTVAAADVHDADRLPDVVAGADAVVSTLGVTFTRQPVNTYSVGTANIVGAMHRTGVRRLVVVSSTGAYHYPNRQHAQLALRLAQPVISRLFTAVYDDIRRMEDVVRDSGLDWTIVRPSGLFDLPEVTDYVAGEVNPVGAFTSRTDLADYLLRSATRAGGRDTTVVSTTAETPSFWRMVRREAFQSAS
jgi:putative NADH-flavin reductase